MTTNNEYASVSCHCSNPIRNIMGAYSYVNVLIVNKIYKFYAQTLLDSKDDDFIYNVNLLIL